MRALVTGAAGFIGSHLAGELMRTGWDVRAVDCLSDYYDLEQKRANVAALREEGPIEHLTTDLRSADLSELLDGVDVVFHQAGQPGVRASWDEFGSYVENNIDVTQRLLAQAQRSPVSRFVFASSSSIYGNAGAYPTDEETTPQPQSPYGVTKLAAEHLCRLYASNWQVPTVALRYFTVYGPRQRPDMAMHRLIEAALTGDTFPMFGAGDQIRDFTYVGDVVRANIAAAQADVAPGTVVNIAGGGSTSLAEVVAIIEELTDRTVDIDRRSVEAGDVVRTGGDVTRAGRLLGWAPAVSIRDGLAAQVRWHCERRELGVAQV